MSPRVKRDSYQASGFGVAQFTASALLEGGKDQQTEVIRQATLQAFSSLYGPAPFQIDTRLWCPQARTYPPHTKAKPRMPPTIDWVAETWPKQEGALGTKRGRSEGRRAATAQPSSYIE